MIEQPLLPDRAIPWLVQAGGSADDPRDAQSLIDWMTHQHGWLENRLEQRGAVIMRGFGIDRPAWLEQLADHLDNTLLDYVGGMSPRQKLEGKVYESTYADAHFPIPLHTELCYLPVVPLRLLLACQIEPRSGGQTPIADMAAVYQALNPHVRELFETRGICFVQTLGPKPTWRNAKSWPEMFEVQDRDEAERRAVASGYEVTWKNDGSLRLSCRCRVSLTDPRDGCHQRKVWFNQAHIPHRSWSWELAQTGQWALAGLLRLFELTRARARSLDDYVMHAGFSDGEPIPRDIMLHVRKTLWDHAVLFDWRHGDLLILDNLWIGHGRMPYKGDRRIILAMANPLALPAGP